jgi:hypothetical protein
MYFVSLRILVTNKYVSQTDVVEFRKEGFISATIRALSGPVPKAFRLKGDLVLTT